MQHETPIEGQRPQNVESINKVKHVEEEAVKTIGMANGEKEKAISDAKVKAIEIVEKAAANAKEKKKKDMNDATKALEKEKELTLKQAEKDASNVRMKRLSAQSKERILKDIIPLILGA